MSANAVKLINELSFQPHHLKNIESGFSVITKTTFNDIHTTPIMLEEKLFYDDSEEKYSYGKW